MSLVLRTTNLSVCLLRLNNWQQLAFLALHTHEQPSFYIVLYCIKYPPVHFCVGSVLNACVQNHFWWSVKRGVSFRCTLNFLLLATLAVADTFLSGYNWREREREREREMMMMKLVRVKAMKLVHVDKRYVKDLNEDNTVFRIHK